MELQELQQAQLSGNAPTIKANNSDKHEIAEAEKDYVHVELTTRTNNPATRKYDEKKRVVAFRPQEFEAMEGSNAFAGYDSVEIIHDPRTKTERTKTDDKAPAPKNKTEWQARYLEVIGEEPASTLTVDELKKAIEEKEKEKEKEKGAE